MENKSNESQMKRIYAEEWLGKVWSKNDTSVAEKILADNFKDHRPFHRFKNNKEGHINMAKDWCDAFSDIEITIEDMIVSGDKLAGRYRGEGMQKSGKRVSFTEIDIVRFEGGQIVEWWHNEDLNEMMG